MTQNRPRRARKGCEGYGQAGIDGGFAHFTRRYFKYLLERDFSPRTIENQKSGLGAFVHWAEERELLRPTDITRSEMESYQRHLYYAKKPNGRPLTFATQRVRISQVSVFFRWMVKRGHLQHNPAAELELPKKPKTLIKDVLSEEEAEAILSVPDVTTATGLRDRALLELIYSTGMRRMEACALDLGAIDLASGTVRVRRGKGAKERYVPMGKRAVFWLGTYLRRVRPELLGAHKAEEQAVFVSLDGNPLNADGLGQRVRRYVKDSGVSKQGGCHLFRHTMATLMLEGGADVRAIQEMLGHERLDSTQIYTRVSLRHLREVHERTHPAAHLDRKPASESGTWHIEDGSWKKPLGYPRRGFFEREKAE